MRSRIFLLSFLLSISLSACAANKTEPAAASSGDPGSQQMTEESTAASTPSPSTPAASTSSPKDESSLPADTYKAVLQNEVDFISSEDNKKFSMNDFLNRNSEYEGIYKVTHFTVLDMDGDKIPEVVLELSLNDYPEQYEILHYSNGLVYGCNFDYRCFEMLKEDGTYSYADSAADVGVVKILSFQSESVKTETLGYAQTDYSGSNAEISYFIDNASVTQEAFNTFLDQQNVKKDAQWYEFSSENIEGKVCMDLNTNLMPAATDNQTSYYGEWKVQKVLAYGIGTYSSDDAEKLVGMKLNFSKDEADVFTDQPSDTAAVINNPEYQETTESGSDFQADYQMSFDTLGISTESVTEVQITSQDEIDGVFLIKDSDTIIMIAGGTYFELVKQ